MFYTHRSEQCLSEQVVNTVRVQRERSILSQAAGEQGGEVTQANTGVVTQSKAPDEDGKRTRGACLYKRRLSARVHRAKANLQPK